MGQIAASSRLASEPRVVRGIETSPVRIPIFWLFVQMYYQRLTHLLVPAEKQKGFLVTRVRDNEVVRKHMKEVLRTQAHHAGQYLALSNDGWYVLWSPSRQSFIAFRECLFTLISWRDPVGPASERAGMLHLFHRYAQARGKQAIFLWVSDASRETLEPKQYQSLWIGTEPYFQLDTYSTRGKSGEYLRHALNSAKKLGATVREMYPHASVEDRRSLLRVEETWMKERPARRTKSFLRTAPLEFIHSHRYFAVETPTETGPLMQGFVVCSPIGEHGWCMQDLVRLPTAPRGIIETGILHAMAVLKAEGAEFSTMTLIPFYDPTGEHSISSWGRLEQWAISYFDKLYRFTGLQQFRTKFAPTSCQHSYVLFWPKMLTPMSVADIIAVMAPSRQAPPYDDIPVD
jgi:lysylphosphatidylglycerol synthetase-like protein (DUF2156 family)